MKSHLVFQRSSATDDGDTDDWGWDDGDVELADKKGRPASFNTPPPSRGLSLKQRSPSMEKKSFAPPAQNYKKGMSLQQSSLQPPLQSQAPRISSLGAPVQPMVKKVVPRQKPKEDDIFASMGLAAQPKFQPLRSPPPSGAAPISGSSWGGISAEGADSAGAAAAWDGDDDLDDLFDD